MDRENYQKAVANCVSMLNRGKITQTEHNYIARAIMTIAEMTRSTFQAVAIINAQYAHDSGYTKEPPIGLDKYDLEPIYFNDESKPYWPGISIHQFRNRHR